jgi:putative Mg2+ transporter-C (MgtC) family protein
VEVGSFSPVHIAWIDALARGAAAALFALALGIERFVRKKPIDFRPYVIVSLASCALTVGTIEFAYRADDPSLSIDPSRVISGIMTGIGFIGAGTLFQEKNVVLGAGSAASIWAAGAIGIVCGFGFLWLGGLLTAGLLAVLILSKPFTQNYTVRIDSDADNGPEDGAP